MEPCTFQPKLEKQNKNHPEKIFFIPRKWDFLTLILKSFLYFLKRRLFLYFGNGNLQKFLTFCQKKNFLIFRETETPRKFFIFQETKLSSIFGNGNPKKLLKLQKVTFRA